MEKQKSYIKTINQLQNGISAPKWNNKFEVPNRLCIAPGVPKNAFKIKMFIT